MIKRLLFPLLLFATAAHSQTPPQPPFAVQPPPTASAPPCAPRVQVVEKLSSKFKEQWLLTALNVEGNVIEFWGSVEKRTWTLLLSRPNGISCLIYSGQEWELDQPSPPGEEL